MLNILIQFVFNVVATIANTFMQPFIHIILQIFPNLSQELSYVVTWFGLAFQYLGCVYRWLLFTPAMFIMLFGYFITKFSVFVTTNVVRMALRTYNTLKP